MKFSKIFNIIIDQHTHEKLIVIDEIYNILSKKEYTIKWNLKKSLQANQGGKILRFGRECATVISLLKYLFNNKTSTYCKTLVKQIEEELVCKSEESCDSTTLNLYHLIAQCKVFQSSLLFETLQINECNIPTLVTDYKTHFNDAEWRIICWFENHVSNTVNCSELSFEDTLKQKFSIYENILKLLECGKSWIQSSKKYLQNNALRVKSSNEFDVTLIAGQRHLATVVDCDIKTLLEIYCPESVEDVVTFDITNSRCSNFIWVAIVQNKSLEINYQDVCQRIFYRVKKKHHVYIERIILVEYDSLKKHVSKDGVIQRFTFRDVLETGRFNTMLDDWRAGECIDGSCEMSESGILANCNRCFSDDHKILTVDTFDIVHEWFLQLPLETQILFESFLNIRRVKYSRTPEEYLTKKLQKLYTLYDILLHVFNKNYVGIFQRSHTNTLLIEHKSIGSVFNVTSTVEATRSLNAAENELRKQADTDLCYYNTYLKEYDLNYLSILDEQVSKTNLRSCHLILLLDNLVRLQYLADPNPGEHRSKQLCTLPITVQGLPFDSKITENWHLSECSGSFNCTCKQRIILGEEDISKTLLHLSDREESVYKSFFNLMTFTYHELWRNLPDELLEQVAVSPVDMIVNDQYISENLGTEFPSQEVEDIHEETDKSDTDSYTSLSAVIESAEFEGESILEDFDMSDNEELSDLGKSFQDMSILEESIETSSATITHCLQSFGFKKFQVPALLCRHPPPATGRDDDLEKIREILDDVLVKAGYEADPNKTVNRILCGPDNKIGKCLFQLQKSSNRYNIFLPEFPLLHLRKSKINILFSAYKDAGLVQLLKFMRDEDQDDWAKLVSIQHIDTATKYVKRIALALHLAFLIAFTQQLDSDDSHALLTELESEECSEMSKRWAAQFEEFLSVGCTRNATFALHFDMMRHCDDIIAIAFAERLGGETGYDLLLAAVKNSLLYLFVNGASSYAPYCVNLLHSHYSAGHFHQCLKHALYSTPFKGSNRNFACDTKREMDHLDVVKGFRSGSNIEAVTCRMSLIDSLNETQKSKDSKEITTDDDCLGMKLSQIDTNHIYPTTALILRRGALSLNESLSPSNVYTKVPLLLPTSILDVNSLDVGSFLLRRFLINEKLYNIKSCSVDESNTCIKGSQELIGRAKRSKGVTIKRTQKAKVVTSKSEREMKEDKRKKEVGRKTKIIDAFSSENNNCQALLKPDSSKPKVAKSIGIQRALKNLILSCPSALPLDSYMSLNASHVPSAITQSMKICTVELAGLKFKLGNIKSGKEYMQTVAGLIDGCCKQSKILSKVVLCEEKYHFTPDDFKAETRNQRKTMSLKDVQHLKTDGQIVSESSFNKDAITKTQKGKDLIGKYAAQNISKLNIKHNIQVIIDSELYIEKDCKCLESCSCKNSEYCIPVVCTFNENGESTLRKMSSIKQRKGEAEMSVLDWTVHLQSELKSGENVVCYVTSSDIDTVYIYAYGIERFWARNEDGSFRNNVYVVLQKSSGKNDIYNITAILTLLEQAYNDLEIGMKLAFTLSMGGNDFLPKFYYISHDTVLQNVFDSAIYRTSLFSNQNGKYQLDKRLYVSLIQYLYTPKRFRDTSIQYEDVRALTISKQEDSSQRGGFKTSDPKKWLPPKSVIERVSELVQFQIEYLETVGSHDSVLPNFCSGHVLVKGSGGEIEYNFGPESRFLSIEDLPKIKNKKKKRTLTDTPQHGARRKKQLTSTPKSK